MKEYAWKLQTSNSKNDTHAEEQFLIDYMVGRREPVLSSKKIISLGVEYEMLDLFVFEGKVDSAIKLLSESVEKRAILLYWLNLEPMYAKLRSHSQWQSIVEKSVTTVNKHREIYLNLVAGEA